MMPARRGCTLALLCVVGGVGFLNAPSVHAFALPEAGGPVLVAPLDQEVVVETGLTFAWTPPAGTRDHVLLISEKPFDPRGWDHLPSSGAVRVIHVARPVVGWTELDRRLEAETRFWWAAAGVLPDGRSRCSAARSITVLARFSNQGVQSPLLATSMIGRAETALAAPSRIRLTAGYEIDPTVGEPALPMALRDPPGPVGGRSLIAYYGEADPEVARRSILAAGGLVVAYVPDHSFLVRMAGGGDLSATLATWVGAYQPAYKIDPRLAEASPEPRLLTLLLFSDASVTGVAKVARAAGAEVVLAADGINKLLRVRAPGSAVETLAREPDVEWIEPFVAPIALNDQAQGIVQTGVPGNRRVWDMGLRGEGQVVMTSDAGVNVAHDQFRDPSVPIATFGDYPAHRKVIAYQRGSPEPLIAFGDHGVLHGTHTAGTVAGSDDGLGVSPLDGIAKNAKLYFLDLSGPLAGNGMLIPADLNDLFQPAYTGNTGGAARISSNSWGAAVNGAYTTESFELDQFAWRHPDFLILMASGNTGTDGGVNSPGSAKNCVTVGASGNGLGLNNYALFTSRGPAQDGRRKPTLVSPGDPLFSANVDPSTYQALSGTSMATPSAAGGVALMRQYLVDGWYPTGVAVPANGFTPSGALLKAMAVNSATNLITGYTAPDMSVGWGRINADSVLYFAGDSRRLLLVDQREGLVHGQAIEYQVNVTDGSMPLEVTLCWADYPGPPLSAVALVNNLNLTMTHGVDVYRGNVYVRGVSVTGGAPDDRNVEECVRVANPAPGVWRVRIDGANVPHGPQGYGLVVTGGVGTTAGSLALDRASYGSSSTVQLRVIDTDAGPDVGVTIASPSEPSGETVTLMGSNGVFTGSIPLSPAAGSAGDGTLRVSSGDILTATYHDASPVATITTTAQVSFVTPVITNVRATNQGTGTVLVSWTTDLNASSRIDYGTTPALGSTLLDPGLVFAHGMTLTGLTVEQTYFFDVESRDVNGNLTRDDNAGAHYRFTVNPRAELLLVYDGASFERHDRYVDAFAALGWTFDLWQGALSDVPPLGDSEAGLRSYKAVWWQSGLERYPPFADAARDSLTAYLNGGGRLAVVGNDLSWANQDNTTSPFYTPARASWMRNTLHTNFLDDPTNWSGVTGVDSDPISGDYTGGVPYAPHRSGAAGDEVSAVPGAGTASYDWLSGDATPANCGFRWESSGPLGTPGTGVWGGHATRLATMYFEWSGIDADSPSSGTRNDILDKTLLWLLGRSRPRAVVTSPNGGEVVTTSSLDITWTEAAFGGTGVANRALDYSLDNGQSWAPITADAGASPYPWDLAAVPNAEQARVRVRITDDGGPPLVSGDVSDASFAIRKPDGDQVGPAVVPGSVRATPNPIGIRNPATLVASISDATAGGANVTHAEWSLGDVAATPGNGQPMTVASPRITVTASVSLPTSSFAEGPVRFWVRGRDAAGNWGAATALATVVNESAPTPNLPSDFGLGAAVPNPVSTQGTIIYGLPSSAVLRLAVYDVSGRLVRSLVEGTGDPGVHVATWDRRDEADRLVDAGVYYYRLAVAGRTFVRRVAVVP